MRLTSRAGLLLLAVGIAACSTEVAVNPKGGPIASVKPNYFTGGVTMTADVKGDLPKVFHAASLTLDNLKYYRTQEAVDQTSIQARGLMDVYVEIDLVASKDPGMTTVAVYLNNGKTPDAQAIFSSMNDQLANMPDTAPAQNTAPAASGRGGRGGRRGGGATGG